MIDVKLRTVGVVSLGCAKNRVDTERMLAMLTAVGFLITHDPANADVLIVNTCGFIEPAKQESIDTILEMAEYKRNRCKVLAVTGCLSERYRGELKTELPEVDIFLGVNEYDKLVPLLMEFSGAEEHIHNYRKKDALGRVLTTPAHTAYLRIADGCDNRCSYCAIPNIRGAYRSEPMERLLDEARALAEGGVKELILIAQDTTRYGQATSDNLPELIRRLSDIGGIEWLRLMYAYPDTVSDELIETLLYTPKVLHYLDLPIQHADDELLLRMNRRGTSADIASIIKKLRAGDPDFILRTSLITGFPGETEESFKRLIRFLSENEFDHVGAFAYSEEEGTPAASFGGKVSVDVKKERLNRLMSRVRAASRRRKKKRIGKTYNVLVEREESGVYIGRSYAEAPDTDGEIYITSEQPLPIGSFAPIKLLRMGNYDFWGETI